MSTAEKLHEIEQFFHRKIPLTGAMGIRVESYDGDQLVLTAPLEINHNHLGTAFGGSLGAIAMLAGYGLVWLMFGGREAHVVVRDAAISFRRPVRGELRAVCRQPDAAVVTAFKSNFSSDGSARIRLSVAINDGRRVAATFEGTFVAMTSANEG